MDVPSEDQMRAQMFKTMAALERWALTSIDFMTADKQPCEQEEKTPGPVLDYSALKAICKRCNGVMMFEDYNRQFNSPEDTCTCEATTMDDVDVSPVVKAVYKAIFERRIAAQLPQPTSPLDGDVEEIRKTLDAHRKALAVVAEFGQFKNVVFGMNPDRQIQSLVKLRACPECVGTGWVARDETCKKCGRKGYIS